jgi:hypothetical protein
LRKCFRLDCAVIFSWIIFVEGSVYATLLAQLQKIRASLPMGKRVADNDTPPLVSEPTSPNAQMADVRPAIRASVF